MEAGGRLLLAGFSLELRAGECVALAGSSGLGKTRLLRAVAGLDDPAAGEVLLQGSTPASMGWPRFRRRVLLVAQRPVMIEGSLLGNLRRPFTYKDAPTPFPKKRARALLRELLLPGKYWRQSSGTLSLGQQQRVALVRALLLEPEVLLLDEPTSALDEEATGCVEALLQQECEGRGMAVLLVSHNRAQAARLCGRRIDLESYALTGEETDV